MRRGSTWLGALLGGAAWQRPAPAISKLQPGRERSRQGPQALPILSARVLEWAWQHQPNLARRKVAQEAYPVTAGFTKTDGGRGEGAHIVKVS